MKPRVAVVGTVVADEIARPGREPTIDLGGIAYTVGALSSLAGDRLEIVPLCRVAADLAEQVAAAWTGLAGVRLDHLLRCAGHHTRVRLDYTVAGLAPGERREILQHPLAPLRTEEIEPVGGIDLALVNCVSGFDVRIDALEQLAARCPVYLDVHSLALSRTPDGTRAPQPVVDGARWLACADWVQCNEGEARALAPTGELVAALTALLRRAGRPRCLLLTQGAAGATVISARGEAQRIAAPRFSAGDPTGAGDAFGAAFVAATMAGCAELEAAGQAVAAATAACTLDGAAQLRHLAAAIKCC